MTPGALAVIAGHTALGVAQRAALAYVVIGLIDYGWKRWRHERQLRMTKQELRDEVRQYGVSAEVKAALRRRQMQLARARMMAAVPDADVVVTNPTHFAVALRYDGERAAPGSSPRARTCRCADPRDRRRARRAARRATRRWRARCTAHVEVGTEIPAELYAAVARCSPSSTASPAASAAASEGRRERRAS